MKIELFKQLPLMGILRGIQTEIIEDLIEAIVETGLKTIEFAMNTENSADLIRTAKKISGDRLTVGAGTVVNCEIMKEALEAGAEFIVIPVVATEVIELCAKKNIPVFPGAFTPDEISRAWNAGASMVKLFPAKFFAPDYIREIKAPLNNVEILACGGVTQENIRDFFSAGADAVAFGGSVFKKEWLENRDYENISCLIKKLISNYSSRDNI